MTDTSVSARVTPTHDLDLATPAGVGLCLSGGGSRAMTAGLGQLRALHELQLDGSSLLSQVAALSTVSGGSWLSVPWTFLPPHISDHDFLGVYRTPEEITVESLQTLADASPGNNIGRDFSIVHMLIELVGLRLVHGTPFNSMWQIVIGRRLLGPYGLYVEGPEAEPRSTFSQDESTKKHALIDPNPHLASDEVHLVADGAREGRTQRALLMCNTSLFVEEPESQLEFLTPVVITPTQAGVLSSPRNVTVNGNPVGGGAVDAFAFGSQLEHRDERHVRVKQDRQLALADIVGISSAAFSQAVEDLGDMTRPESRRQHRQYLRERLEIERALGETPTPVSFFHRILDHFRAWLLHRVISGLSPRQLVPQYGYWPVRGDESSGSQEPAHYADGGSLENTGIASMLTRTKIDRIIACLNSENELTPVQVGVVDVDHEGNVHEKPDTRVQVASEIPYLFGYRAHNRQVGYVRFGDTPDHDLGAEALFKHNHVFTSDSFAELLRGLAKAAGDGLRSEPVVFEQKLITVDNHWFGVAGGRIVTVVWVYLNPVDGWTARLTPDVRQVAEKTKNFPNYSTFDTQLSATEFSLLSDLTAWSLACDSSAEVLIDLFRS